MAFPKPFYRWRPHPWHGLEVGPSPPQQVNAYIEITPFDLVKYEIDVRRYSEMKAARSAIAIGDAVVSVDGEPIYTIKGAKSGVFRGIGYGEYPWPGKNAKGGRLVP